MSDSLQPHGLQHARPPRPSPTPGVYSNSCPLSRWCHPAISSSVIPFFSCLQSLPASVQFSRSIVSDSLRPLCNPMNRSTPGLPVHHQLPEFTQTHVHCIGDTTQPSHPLSSPSPPAFNPPASGAFPMSQLCTSGGQNIGASASTSVLPMNTQDWSPLSQQFQLRLLDFWDEGELFSYPWFESLGTVPKNIFLQTKPCLVSSPD